MSDLAYDIEQLYIEGHTPRMISIMLECPIEQVLGWLIEVGVSAAEEEFSPHSTINS
jgi:hypothetical protein